MSTKGYKITSFIICDELREEVSGKHIIIGMYNSALITTSLPATLPKITFRICIEFDRRNFKKCIFEILGPARKKIVAREGMISKYKLHEPAILVFPFFNPAFETEGVHSVRIGFDAPPRKFAEFEVRVPKKGEKVTFR